MPVSRHGEHDVRPGVHGRRAVPAYVSSSSTLRRLDREPAAVGHRVARVDHEVHDRPARSGRDRPSTAPEARVERRSSARCPRRSGAAASAPCPAITAFRSSTRGSRTCRRLKASSWRVSAAARSPACRISSTCSRAAGRLSGSCASEQLAVAGDRRQQVVEVVRDAAGEPADRLHLLRLPELLLQPAALGHVEDRSEERFVFVLLGPEERHVLDDPDRASVLAPALILVGHEAALAAQTGDEILPSLRARVEGDGRTGPWPRPERRIPSSARRRGCTRGGGRPPSNGRRRKGCARTADGNAPRTRGGRAPCACAP